LIIFIVCAATARDGNKDPGITREQAEDILKELRQIRQLLETQAKPVAPAPRTVPQTGKLRLGGGFSLGSNDAPITIVEFTDYQCPFCRQFQNTTFAELRKKYIDSGKVRFIVRNFPLGGHPNAMPAAEAARCAGDQGKFWPMHDTLFGEPDKLVRESLVENAEVLKLDVGMFRSCLDSDKHKTEIQNDMQTALSLQIMATPSFLVGKTTGEDLEGVIIIGSQPLAVFQTKMKELVGSEF
jgi:protein-disulfide isomerase